LPGRILLPTFWQNGLFIHTSGMCSGPDFAVCCDFVASDDLPCRFENRDVGALNAKFRIRVIRPNVSQKRRRIPVARIGDLFGMIAPLLKKRSRRETGSVAMGWRDLDWERLAHDDALVVELVEATRAAGQLAFNFFRSGEKTSATITRKTGGSPVTEADHAANRCLELKLRKILPDAGWLSEESEDSLERLNQELVLIVDPIDGTRSFVAGDPGWAVAVGVIHRQRPVIGIVHAPALGETYVAVKNAGAQLNGSGIRVSGRAHLEKGVRVAGPVAFAQQLHDAGLEFELLPKIPSLALRIAKVAAGEVDACLVSANSHDWDIAAAEIILDEAGGGLATLDGRQVLYNRVGTRHGELVAGSSPILAEIGAAVMRARAG
jgi:myo-inositol-1(or 4)-monophosphatase